MSTPTDHDLAVLRALAVSGAVTANELAPLVGRTINATRDALERLRGHGFLNVERIPTKPAIYTMGGKGKRLLDRERQPMGIVAGPRVVAPLNAPPYTGMRAIVTRPGAMDAYDLPSLTGGERTPRARPMLIGKKP